MALSLREIAAWCEQENREFWEYMLEDDIRQRSVSAEESLAQMRHCWEAMQHTIATYQESRLSASGLVGADGGRLERYVEDPKSTPLGGTFVNAAMAAALKMAEANACMRRIVAAPTAGSCGVIPAVLVPYYAQRQPEEEAIIRALYVAGAIGEVIAQRASVSGAQGGCQAEIGSASAMAAGALTYLQGGSIEQIMQAAALALKGLLGLACDPVAGLVEVPCVKRNVIGTVNAISCADMAMAGIRSQIPPDEVIDAMGEIGEKMDVSLRETAIGGLAATPAGRKIAAQFQEEQN